MRDVYIATGEQALLICACDESHHKALKKIAKKIKEMEKDYDSVVFHCINSTLDNDGIYSLTATISVW